MASHPHLIPKLKFVKLYIHSPICFHGVQNGNVTVILLSIRTVVVCVPYRLVCRVVAKVQKEYLAWSVWSRNCNHVPA